MSTLKAYGDAVVSIFQLIGDKENDITKSISWALNKCPVFMNKVVNEVFGIDVNPDEVNGIPVKHLSWSKIYELAANCKEA